MFARISARRYGKIFAAAFAAVCFGLMLVFPEGCKKGAAEGLELCLSVLIPSLFPFMAAAGLVGAVNYLVLIAYAPKPYYLFGVVGTLTLLLAVYVFTFPRFHADQVVAAFAGMVYVAVTLGFIYLTRMAYDGHVLVWLIFLSSWGADTCAYCVGRLLGRHKMAPILSPKKSVEGAVGGVLGAGLLGLAYGSYLGRQGWIYFLICSVGALISMVGDLAASGIKRDKGIKDYGDLIPGHGGILDRFDSVIFTAPVSYFLSILLIRV